MSRREPGVRQRHLRGCPRLEDGRGYAPHRCNGTWEYVLEVGEGRSNRVQEKKGGFATYEAARTAKAKRLATLVGRPVRAQQMTVAQFLTEWLEAKRRLRPSTRETYEDYVKRLWMPRIGGLRLAELEANPLIVVRMFADIAATPNRHGRKLSPATMKRIHAVFRGALGWGVNLRYLGFNPAQAVELEEVRRPSLGEWTGEDAVQFWTFLDGDVAAGREPERLRALYKQALATAMRRGELLGQEWDRDVDLDARMTFVTEQRVKTRAGVVVGPPKTKSGSRPIALDDMLSAVLAVHRDEQDRERAAAGDGWAETGLVYVNADGTPLNPDYATRHFKTLCRQAGVPVIRFHDLRHVSITLALLAGVLPKVVSARAGHSSTWFTQDRYVYVDHAVNRNAAEQIAAVFDLGTRRTTDPVRDRAGRGRTDREGGRVTAV
jgi:integrase